MIEVRSRDTRTGATGPKGQSLGRTVSAARPTLRCLREDLVEDWEDAQQRGALTSQPLVLPPLDKVAHPVVRHAAEVFPSGAEVDARRETISGLSDPVWFKLKTGRWRGAVHVDSEGQAWLCAAGLRRERESTDFYAAFMSAIGANGPDQFLPTEEDRARLRLERAEAFLDDWELSVHRVTTASFAGAAETGSATFTVPGLMEGDADLMTVTIDVEVVDDDDGGIVDVVAVMTRQDWSRVDLAERADLVVLAAINPDEQAWDISSSSTGPIHSVLITQDEFRGLVARAAAGGKPVQLNAGTRAHYTHQRRLTDSTVNGTAVRALCGVWFVPRQDHESFEKCERCCAVERRLNGPG